MTVDEAIESVERALKVGEATPEDFDILMPAASRLVCAVADLTDTVRQLQADTVKRNRILMSRESITDLEKRTLQRVRNGTIKRNRAASLLGVDRMALEALLVVTSCD